MTSIEDRRESFAKLHESGCFVIPNPIGLTVRDLADLGVRRISVGSALARTAWGSFIRAAKAIAENGSFEGLEGAASFAELNRIFSAC